jgi:hypothetical protein
MTIGGGVLKYSCVLVTGWFLLTKASEVVHEGGVTKPNADDKKSKAKSRVAPISTFPMFFVEDGGIYEKNATNGVSLPHSQLGEVNSKRALTKEENMRDE